MIWSQITVLNIVATAFIKDNQPCEHLPIVAIDRPITVTFDDSEYQSCSINLTRLKNAADEDDHDEEVEGVTTRDAATHTLLFTPKRDLSYGSEYML